MNYLISKSRNAPRRFFLLVITFTILQNVLAVASDGTKNDAFNYVWPTNASRTISSSFAESRKGHYHFGIDIKTNQTEGYSCFAIADGSVVRVRVSPYGYGKALYLQLDDGRMAVYGHLQRFSPRIEKIIREEQYKNRQFRCQIYFEPGEIVFRKGETVAWTGSTGTGSPHLHFEIREEDGFRNAMSYGFGVQDSRAPVARKLALIPRGIEAEINGGFDAKIFPLQASAKKELSAYSLQEIPTIFGPVGLGISGYDQTDGAPNRISFYGMDLYWDDSLTFSARYETIKYGETKQIELERNYRLQKQGKGAFHHLFRDPDITADIYRAGDGHIDTRSMPPGLHDFEIVLWDFNGNASHIKGKIEFKASPDYPLPVNPEDLDEIIGFPDEKDFNLSPVHQNRTDLQADFHDDYAVLSLLHEDSWESIHLFLTKPFDIRIPIIKKGGNWIGRMRLSPVPSNHWLLEVQSENRAGAVEVGHAFWRLQSVTPDGGSVLSEDSLFRADFKPGALYKTLFVRIEDDDSPNSDELRSKIYHLDPFDIPIKGDVSVSISIPPEETAPEKLGIYRLSKKGKWTFCDNDLSSHSGSVYCTSPSLETFVLIKDGIPPEIRWLGPQLVTSEVKPDFHLEVIDELSGIDDRTLSFEIDGQWTLMEYDYEKDLIMGQPREPLTKGDHIIEFSVKDYSGNEARLQRTLRVEAP